MIDFDSASVQLGHGSGGRLSHQLISELFIRVFSDGHPDPLDDAARLTTNTNRLVFSTDSFVVDPVFFPGGNIGDLAINGTVNDLLTSGGTPLAISAAFILEEGFPFRDLKTIVETMKKAADVASVRVVTGDTKVVERGKADKIFITTTGVAEVDHDYAIDCSQIRPGDAIIVTGTVADHGMAILAGREGLSLEATIASDTASLGRVVHRLFTAVGDSVHAMRDPTRGGVASALNELAESSSVGIELIEAAIPIRPPVAGACEILGIDPLLVANEGKMLVAVAPDVTEVALAAIKADPLGSEAAVIGHAHASHPGRLTIRTPLGASRILDMPLSDPLPRIC